MNSLSQFTKKSYLNLETFRKSGESLKTPVWFVADGDLLYIRTLANSGKVKRIRRNGQVNIVPCRMDGKPQGTWTSAQAREMKEPEIFKKVDHLMDKKYGLLKRLFFRGGADQARGSIILEVKIV